MNKSLLFFMLLFEIASSTCSREQTKQVRELKEIKNFLSQVYEQELKDSSSILTNEPSKIAFNEIKDEAFFTPADRKEIEAALIQSTIIDWEKVLLKQKKYISQAKVDTIFSKKDPFGGWNYVYKHVGKKIATVSVPVFFRNNTFCLFYADYSCGWLCGYGELNLFQKKNNKWIKIRTFSSWIS
ncbi:MAG: hypothetical protein AAGB30_02095 [Pedobacter sp.]|nr:hypothetical protein [Pedobacter sp.]